MKEINVYKAQPTGKEEVPSLTICAYKTIPNERFSECSLTQLMEIDAEKLERYLYETLPGGTYDRLLHQMLKRVVPHTA